MKKIINLVSLIETLVDEKAKIPNERRNRLNTIGPKIDLGFSQFNEILLLLGFNRINNSFFQYLVNGEIRYEEGSSIKTIEDLEKGTYRFITLALLWYGNIKFAFKTWSKDFFEFEERVFNTTPFEKSYYTLRHSPITEIIKIPEDRTYLLGYISAGKLNDRKKANPSDPEVLALLEERKKYIEIGKKNQIAYLTSDHLDIYVATSMRLDHEFLFVSRLINSVFSKKILSELKVRWFDPTQAYCHDRIDKGLSEALMLKRAKCTLYLVQEADTLGKDSELASTLAQGKPVVAYVPNGNKRYVDSLVKDLKKLNPHKEMLEIIKEQLEVFKPSLAWHDNKVISWLSDENPFTLQQAKDLLYRFVKEHYDKRAETLKNNHPLGIQVNLISGVANGVLVVRNENDCAKLIHSIIMNDMKFDISFKSVKNEKNVYLREKISQSIFRIKTSDKLLDNSFWNFYTDPNS